MRRRNRACPFSVWWVGNDVRSEAVEGWRAWRVVIEKLVELGATALKEVDEWRTDSERIVVRVVRIALIHAYSCIVAHGIAREATTISVVTKTNRKLRCGLDVRTACASDM